MQTARKQKKRKLEQDDTVEQDRPIETLVEMHYLEFYTHLINFFESNGARPKAARFKKFSQRTTFFLTPGTSRIWLYWPTEYGMQTAVGVETLLVVFSIEESKIEIFREKNTTNPELTISLVKDQGRNKEQILATPATPTTVFTEGDIEHFVYVFSLLFRSYQVSIPSKETTITFPECVSWYHWVSDHPTPSLPVRIEKLFFNGSHVSTSPIQHHFAFKEVTLNIYFSLTTQFNSWVFPNQTALTDMFYDAYNISGAVYFHRLTIENPDDAEKPLLDFSSTLDGRIGMLEHLRAKEYLSGKDMLGMFKFFRTTLFAKSHQLLICDDASLEAKQENEIYLIPLRLLRVLAGKPDYYEETLQARLFTKKIVTKLVKPNLNTYEQNPDKRKLAIKKLREMTIAEWKSTTKTKDIMFSDRLTRLCEKVYPAGSMLAASLTIGRLVKDIYEKSAAAKGEPTPELIEISKLLCGSDKAKESLAHWEMRSHPKLVQEPVGKLVDDILWNHGRIWIAEKKEELASTECKL